VTKNNLAHSGGLKQCNLDDVRPSHTPNNYYMEILSCFTIYQHPTLKTFLTMFIEAETLQIPATPC